MTVGAGCTALFDLDRPVGRADAALADADPDAMPDAPEDSVFALSGARWLLPCVAPLGTPPGACTCPTAQSSGPIAVGAPSTVTWSVTIHIRGAMEAHAFTGGVSGPGGFYTGGMPMNSNENVFRMNVSKPSQTYYLNNGVITSTRTFAHDYTAVILIAAGATVTFVADGQDGRQWQNNDGTGMPNTIAGITEPAQPYDGQFARIDVLSVTQP